MGAAVINNLIAQRTGAFSFTFSPRTIYANTQGTFILDSLGRPVLSAIDSNAGSDRRCIAARWNTKGEWDTLFGSGVPNPGVVLYDYGFVSSESNAIIEVNGKYVLAGTAGATGDFNHAMCRLNFDGSFDSTFGTNGKLIIARNPASSEDFTYAMLQDLSGRYVLCGYATISGALQFGALRLKADFTLDTSFGTNGFTSVSFVGDFAVSVAIGIQSDGKIILAGNAYDGTSDYDFALARLDTNGVLDDTFGSSGIQRTAPSTYSYDVSRISAIAIDSANRIYTCGWAFDVDNYILVLARYSSAGILDNTFGTNGLYLYGDLSNPCYGNGIAIDETGNVYLVGGFDVIYATGVARGLLVVKLNSAGSPVSSFGNNGIVKLTSVNGINFTNPNAFIAYRDQKLTCFADYKEINRQSAHVLRLSANTGLLDPTFGRTH
jgi:uncharacterized delta-60 repeat protein